MNKRQIGSVFEKAAEQYLLKKGYCILARNFRHRNGEIDLIARDGDTLVFAEVKYRSTGEAGDPLEAVTLHKQKQISDAALYYLLRAGCAEDTPCRFDVIAISGGHLQHIENAFDFVPSRRY